MKVTIAFTALTGAMAIAPQSVLADISIPNGGVKVVRVERTEPRGHVQAQLERKPVGTKLREIYEQYKKPATAAGALLAFATIAGLKHYASLKDDDNDDNSSGAAEQYRSNAQLSANDARIASQPANVHASPNRQDSRPSCCGGSSDNDKDDDDDDNDVNEPQSSAIDNNMHLKVASRPPSRRQSLSENLLGLHDNSNYPADAEGKQSDSENSNNDSDGEIVVECGNLNSFGGQKEVKDGKIVAEGVDSADASEEENNNTERVDKDFDAQVNNGENLVEQLDGQLDNSFGPKVDAKVENDNESITADENLSKLAVTEPVIAVDTDNVESSKEDDAANNLEGSLVFSSAGSSQTITGQETAVPSRAVSPNPAGSSTPSGSSSASRKGSMTPQDSNTPRKSKNAIKKAKQKAKRAASQNNSPNSKIGSLPMERQQNNEQPETMTGSVVYIGPQKN